MPSMTLSPAKLYTLILAALNRLQDDNGHFRRGVEKNQISDDEFWLLNRFRYFPNTVTPTDFQTFGPYTSSTVYEQSLESLVAKSLAEKVEPNRYRVSELGRKLVDSLYRDYFNYLAKHPGLPAAEAQRLAALVDRALSSALPQPEVPSLITNATRSTFPAMDDPWVLAERRVVALTIFHEDAHIAAWRSEGWSGPRVAISGVLFKASDRLTYQALRTATAQLDDKDFRSALSALHSGDEISHSTGDRFALTKAGRAAREHIEELTDRNFALPFNALEPAELKELIALLEKVRGPIES